MKIAYGFPPNYDDIANSFKVRSDTVYTYGDTLYSPISQSIPPDLIIHEETHVKQQKSDPQGWWDKYIASPQFRLSQEVEAYRNQYHYYSGRVKDKNYRDKFIRFLATSLSSDVYGNICSYSEAMRLIKQ